MQATFLTVPARQPILETLDLFVKSGVSGALVVDEDGAIVGQLRTHDLLQALDQALDEDLDEGEEEPEHGLHAVVAADLATRDIVWASPGATVRELVSMLRDRGVDRVVVGEDGVAAGMITPLDLLAALD